ncbi:hypothetical protein BGZ65_000987 [Modicella reniformis]|uniref:Aminotransferase class I/classII large domain-containing protein n=1 Tax=Modicella reniformis TaxID=1440133 RepID=A0A9P6SN52_9FUNG|nr:hypothetical protein BGZ65_000987 [Modicella reniformis]
MTVINEHELPMAKDFSSFLSTEGASRKKGLLKGLFKFMTGFPHPSTFPFYSLSAEVKSMAPAGASPAIHNTVSNGKTNSIHSHETVTVPHGPLLGKAESLSTSLQYGIGTGIESLRQFCKEHVNRMHRPQYQDWDVITSAGNTDAFAKVILMLCNRGDKVLVEEWTYPSAFDTMAPIGVGHVPVKMDSEGMSAVSLKDILDNWGSTPGQNHKAKPRVVYLIPTGQNPTGTTMSIQRRRDIMQVAQEHNLILIEDDPYYYLQFFADEGQESNEDVNSRGSKQSGWVPSLLSMDTDGRVIRLDTFSKTLAPGCRVGYMSMNARFYDIIQCHNELTIQQPSGFSQAILAETLISHWGQEGYTRCKPKPTDMDSEDMLNVWSDEEATYLRATFAYATFEQMDQAIIRFGKSLNEVFAASTADRQNLLSDAQPMGISQLEPDLESGAPPSLLKQSRQVNGGCVNIKNQQRRSEAICIYFFGTLFTGNFVLIFVLCVLMLVFDFWTVKNVSGRLLVGLRWWNENREDGTTTWYFESRDQSRPLNPVDSRLFWTGLYVAPAIWVLFGILCILTFEPTWLLIVAVALALNFANVIGYTQCDKDAKQKWASGFASNVLGGSGGGFMGGLMSRGISRMAGSMF